jgi:hypothetical protein
MADNAISLRSAALADRYATPQGRRLLQWAKRWLDANYDQSGPAGSLPLDDLLVIDGRVAPVLRELPVHSRVMPRSASRTIVQLIEDDAEDTSDRRDVVEEVLRASDLRDDVPGFSTVYGGDTPRIHGRDGSSLRHLEGIAHELGHCLAKDRGDQADALDLIASECCALICGEAAVATYLRADAEACATWHAHQRVADRLAVEIFTLDLAELSMTRPRESRFDPRLKVLRTSFLAAPGYELFYALASTLRTDIMSSWACGDVRLSGVVDWIVAGQARVAVTQRLAVAP